MTLLTFTLQLNQHNFGALTRNFWSVAVATTLVETWNLYLPSWSWILISSDILMYIPLFIQCHEMSHWNHPPLCEMHVLNSVILMSHSDSVPTLHSHDKLQQFSGHGKLQMFRLTILKAGTVVHCEQARLYKQLNAVSWDLLHWARPASQIRPAFYRIRIRYFVHKRPSLGFVLS
jgi:hypothetical protein